MNKHGALWVGIVIAVIFLLGIAGTITYFVVKSQPQAGVGTIPSQCTIKSSGTTSGAYTCPSSASFCSVNIELNCNTQTGSPKVVLRWSNNANILSFEPDQLALDFDGDGDLDRWQRTTTSGGNANAAIRFPAPYDDAYVGYYNGKVVVCHPRSGSNSDLCRQYQQGGSIPLELGATEPYASQGLEIYSGNTQTYQCSQTSTGSKQITVTYSGSKAGTKVQGVVLNKGENIGWTGKINYTQETVKQSVCTAPKAGNTPNSYVECKVDNDGCGVYATSQTFCTGDLIWKDSEKACGVPYTLLVISNKDVYGIGEAISGSVELKDTNKRDFVEITVTLKDQLNSPKAVSLITTNTQGRANYVLPAQNLEGDYKIVVEAAHPDGRIPIEKNIAVAQPINARLNAFPDQIQYNSEPIRAKVFVTDNQGNARDAKTWDLSGTKCGNTDVSNDVQIQRLGRTSQGTEYLLSTPISTSCSFVYKVIAIDDSGFKSNPAAITIDVRASEIQIKPDLTTIQDKDAGRYNVKFKTLNPNLQPISTTATVVVTDSDGCESGKFCLQDNANIPAVVVAGSNGDYSFSHNYKDGLNTITITASGAGIQSSTQTFTVNLFPSSTQDPIGGGSEVGGMNVGVIITIVLVLFVTLAILYFIFFRRKN